MTNIGKPYEGKPHVRFDEEGQKFSALYSSVKGYLCRQQKYARVSTKDQNEDRQLTVLREQGIPEEYIFVDKVSGKNFDRPEYQLLKQL